MYYVMYYVVFTLTLSVLPPARLHFCVCVCCSGQLLGRKILVKEDVAKSERKFVKPPAGVRETQSLHSTKLVRWDPEDRSVELVATPAGGEEELAPERSVYVSNLAFDVSIRRLVQFLALDLILSDSKMQAMVGRVQKVRLLLSATGRSRGRAFVQFETARDAQEAVARIHSTPLRGREVYARLMNDL